MESLSSGSAYFWLCDFAIPQPFRRLNEIYIYKIFILYIIYTSN